MEGRASGPASGPRSARGRRCPAVGHGRRARVDEVSACRPTTRRRTLLGRLRTASTRSRQPLAVELVADEEDDDVVRRRTRSRSRAAARSGVAGRAEALGVDAVADDHGGGRDRRVGRAQEVVLLGGEVDDDAVRPGRRTATVSRARVKRCSGLRAIREGRVPAGPHGGQDDAVVDVDVAGQGVVVADRDARPGGAAGARRATTVPTVENHTTRGPGATLPASAGPGLGQPGAAGLGEGEPGGGDAEPVELRPRGGGPPRRPRTLGRSRGRSGRRWSWADRPPAPASRRPVDGSSTSSLLCARAAAPRQMPGDDEGHGDLDGGPEQVELGLDEPAEHHGERERAVERRRAARATTRVPTMSTRNASRPRTPAVVRTSISAFGRLELDVGTGRCTTTAGPRRRSGRSARRRWSPGTS